jgi:hypothetical protein
MAEFFYLPEDFLLLSLNHFSGLAECLSEDQCAYRS